MPLESITIPTNAVGRHHSEAEIKDALARLQKGETVSDGVVYDRSRGKRSPRDLAQIAAFQLRLGILADAPELDPKEVASKTFEVHADEKPTGGYRFGVFLKTV